MTLARMSSRNVVSRLAGTEFSQFEKNYFTSNKMDAANLLIAQFFPESISPNKLISGYQNIIPYAILLINFILFKLLRYLVDALLDDGRWFASSSKQPQPRLWRLLKLFCGELISTCELCADCAELNVVHEKHGPLAYAAGLFLLTYLWMDAFGDAQTTPGYLAEELFLIQGKQILASGETYARFVGQSMALPLAWRFASTYWHYHLLAEHRELLVANQCKSALSTSTINGFLIEFGCCLLCRLIELVGHKILEQRSSHKRMVSLVVSFSCTLLVMLALELSGGYFNPILAASLEYGCKGIHFYQHAIVFWLGPLGGHVLARLLYRRFVIGELSADENSKAEIDSKQTVSRPSGDQDGRPRRTTSQRRKRHRD